ncbi:DUF4307 domain-containing protein [Georgenia faecalis]|uniref:DUF4307 domain-containing protein n=1 Tax=Georgenia faecalis TaxID=2483799 RepID=UPI0013DFA509|nr:DUF4307 domain-containing protein [Georgenia faecalis]
MSPAPYGDAESSRAMLDARYGVPRRSRRALLAAVAVLAVVAFVVFAYVSTNEPVRTQEAGYRSLGPDAVEVTFTVVKAPEIVADCTVIALGESFSEVGAATVRVGPDPGQKIVSVTTTVRTASPAQGARVDGCTVVKAP